MNGLAGVATASAHSTFQYLASHDIVALCETKLGSVPHHLLPEHTLHSLAAECDHASGQGLLLGVRKSLGLSVRPWFPACGFSGAIWLQVCHTATSEQYFFGVCYVPPTGSRQLRRRNVERRLHSLRREVAAASSVGTVFLGGNFNAKLRRQLPSATHTPPQSIPVRTCGCILSRCTCPVNDHGTQLLALCDSLDMILCTGRVPGDRAASPTWVANRGTPSRLDHFLVSMHAFPMVTRCSIPVSSRRRLDSDHQP